MERKTMMRLYTRIAVAALLLSGCQGSRTIGGQVDQTQFRLADAQAIAIASDGKIYRSHVGADGRFQLALETDATYTLRFANATSDATRYDAFAVLVGQSADGSRHENFFLTAGDAIELGLIRRAGTISSALTAASDDEELDDDDTSSEDEDADTDSDGRRDDGLTACDLSDGSDLVIAEAENSLLGENDSDGDGVSDDEDSDDCDSDSDSDDEASETDQSEDDDSDSDSDSEAGMACEDAADMMDDECSEPGENEPAPNPGSGSGAPDCAANPSDPGCL
jgi:hypothetical protein